MCQIQFVSFRIASVFIVSTDWDLQKYLYSEFNMFLKMKRGRRKNKKLQKNGVIFSLILIGKVSSSLF